MGKLIIMLNEFRDKYPLLYSKLGPNYKEEIRYFSEDELDEWEKSLSYITEITEIEHQANIEKEDAKIESDEWVIENFERGIQKVSSDTYLYNEIQQKQGYRKKLNNLRKLRVKDLLKLKELRGGVFRYYSFSRYCEDEENEMQRLFEFLDKQLEDFKDKVYINTEKSFIFYGPNHNRDIIRFSNNYLITKFHISNEEQRHMKSIISKLEKRRRNNEYNKSKFKMQRRNSNGLTSRQQSKLDKERRIIELINEGLSKTEIAKRLNLNKSSMSSTYKYLFDK